LTFLLLLSSPGLLRVFSGALAPERNFVRCKINVTSKSCVLLHWQRYYTALEQRASAKLCGMVYKEWNYGTFAEGVTDIRLGGHHVWASAHILVF